MSTRAPPSERAVQQLIETASLLSVEEVLDLCFAFSKDPMRLTVYLEVLRRKGGSGAQAAACMICFDLARAGHGHFEREFNALLPVVQDIHARGGDDNGLIDGLIGESEYLKGLWADLVRRLTAVDPRVDEPLETPDVIEIDLFDDDDIVEIQIDNLVEVAQSGARLQAGWLNALERFFVVELALPNMADPSAPLNTGFCAQTKSDVRRVEQLRNDAMSFRDLKHPNDLLPIAEIFLASHMRSRNLFGRQNQQRAAVLQSGLASFVDLDAPPEDVVSWLLPPTSTEYSWEKVAEILIDFIIWMDSLEPGDVVADESFPDRLAYGYLRANRPQPPPDVLSSSPGHRRR